MAAFNPEEPKTNDPNWLAYSKPIQQPNFKSTLGSDLKDAGNIFEMAVKGADQYVQDTAKRDVQDQLQPLKDDREQSLQAASDLIRGKVAQAQPVTSGPGAPTDILGGAPQQSTLPADAQSQLKALEVFKDARAKGSITQTDYDGRASALLSSIRSKYPPAYRDAIDSEASKIMGGDPANAHIRSLLADINSFIGSGQEGVKAMENDLRNHIYLPGGEMAYQRFLKDRDLTAASNFLAAPLQREYQLKQLKEQADMANTERGLQLAGMKEWVNATADASYQNMLHGTLSSAGLSVDQLQQTALDYQSGAKKADPVQAQTLAGQARAYADAIEADIRRRAREGDKTGLLSKDDIDNAVARGRAPMDQIAKSFGDQNYGSAFDLQRKTKALEQKSDYEIINNPDAGHIVATSGSLTRLLGPNVAARLSEENAILKLQPHMERFYDKARTDLSTPPGQEDPKNPTQFPTFKSAVDALTSPKATSDPKYAYTAPKTFDALLNIIVGEHGSLIARDTPETVKQAIFIKTFSPDNWGMLKNIAPDKWVDGKLYRGQQTVFSMLSHPDIAAEAKRQGPEAVKMYTDFIKTTAEQDIMKNDLLKLNGLSQTIAEGGKQLRWNPDTSNFDVKLPDNSSLMRRFTGKNVDPLSATVKNLNSTLTSLRNVATETGQEPNRFVLQSVLDLTGHGGEVDEHGNVQGLDVAKIPGIPGALVKEIVDSRERKIEADAKQKAFDAAVRKKYLPQGSQ